MEPEHPMGADVKRDECGRPVIVRAREPAHRGVVAIAAICCFVWIGVAVIAGIALGKLGCLDDTYAREHDICGPGVASTSASAAGVYVTLAVALVTGCVGVWRRTYRPIAWTAALVWLVPPVVFIGIAQATSHSFQ
jgi:hypothetical protein